MKKFVCLLLVTILLTGMSCQAETKTVLDYITSNSFKPCYSGSWTSIDNEGFFAWLPEDSAQYTDDQGCVYNYIPEYDIIMYVESFIMADCTVNSIKDLVSKWDGVNGNIKTAGYHSKCVVFSRANYEVFCAFPDVLTPTISDGASGVYQFYFRTSDYSPLSTRQLEFINCVINSVTFKCGACLADGSGVCSNCEGTGSYVAYISPEWPTYVCKCPNCKGSGDCHSCSGYGYRGAMYGN